MLHFETVVARLLHREQEDMWVFFVQRIVIAGWKSNGLDNK